MVHILSKPGLENFEHHFASMWDECNCAVVWAFFGIAFLWDWNETDLFQSCCHCWVFQICWHNECSNFTASSFRIQNSLPGILSLPLALFVVMLPKACLTLYFRMSGSSPVITPLWLLESSLWWLQQWNWKMLPYWKKSYDQPRQHIKKQRYYFATKCPSSQSYGFSSSHEWMWKLDYKEGWVPKNWCFCSVVLGSLGLQGDPTSLS